MVESQPRRRAIVLLSGGLDSGTTLGIARREQFECHALTIDYGQRHRIELDRAARVATSLGAASHKVVQVGLDRLGGSSLTDPSVKVGKDRSSREIGTGIPATYVPARNTVFLSIALGYAEVMDARDIFLGVNAVDYSGYPDCRPAFLEAFETLASVATRAGVEGERFRIHAPLLQLSKSEIVRKAMEVGLDPALTLSCYDPNSSGVPCERCDACILRARGFEEAGIPDPVIRGR
jgi:7-cyano-7-deazaguanine synthase